MNYVIFLLITLSASVGWSACPSNPSIESELNQTYKKLKSAKFPEEAQLAVSQLWGLWTQAPDSKAQKILNRGMSRIRQGDLATAEVDLTELIEYCPNYAEGYNQRAFARYLAFKFDKALPDLVKALDLRPRHLGALSGKGLTHKALGQDAEAEIEFRKTLTLNPFTPERDMILDLGVDL